MHYNRNVASYHYIYAVNEQYYDMLTNFQCRLKTQQYEIGNSITLPMQITIASLLQIELAEKIMNIFRASDS